MKNYNPKLNTAPRGELANLFKLPKVLTVLAQDGSGNAREVSYYHEDVLNTFVNRVIDGVEEVRTTIASPKEDDDEKNV